MPRTRVWRPSCFRSTLGERCPCIACVRRRKKPPPPAPPPPPVRQPLPGHGKNITRAKRERIYARDGYVCLACGESDRAQLSIDHIIPRSRGGTSHDENLQTLCRRCNGGKANRVALGIDLHAEVAR